MADPVPGVVVVNYGSCALLERHLSPLAGLACIVVVDNFSTPSERARVIAAAEVNGWELVRPAGNPGFGAGVNLGVERARRHGCRELVLVNPDAEVAADVVTALAEHVRVRPDDVVCPRLVDTSGAVVFDGSEIDLRTGALRRPRGGSSAGQPWLTGACVALSLDLFTRLGGFAEEYFLYWEDVDLSYRAARAGATLMVRADLTARHDEGGTHGPGGTGPGKSRLYYRWNARNRLLFAARNLPTPLVLSWLVHTPAESWAILLRGGRRQLVRSPAPLVAIVAGSLAGATLALRALALRLVHHLVRARSGRVAT